MRRRENTIQKKSVIFTGLMIILILSSCSYKLPENAVNIALNARIYPDYSNIVIPPNIAPLNFKINEKGRDYIVSVKGKADVEITIQSKDGIIQFPLSDWKKLLATNINEDIIYSIYILDSTNTWRKYNPIVNKVVTDEIDSYVSYRKIPPANIIWKEMGIYQRSLETFHNSPIMVNKMSDENCMNCHSFNLNNPNQFLFHMRGKPGGTIIMDDNKIKFVNTFSQHTRGAGAYPSWHPDGRFIAFSVNKVNQHFHSKIGKITFVKDRYSDIILYDRKDNSITRPALLATSMLENLPTWSSDGKQLYFIRAEEITDSTWYEDIRYNLCRVDFNPETKNFNNDTVIFDARKVNISLTYPRVSPDNKFISFILVKYGYFSIYSKEADVYLYNLKNARFRKLTGNSNEVESYPSWSANGRWLMFVSKREDGLFSQLWFSYIFPDGRNSKPFVLPQKDPDFYLTYLYNYNRPEFMIDEVDLDPLTVLNITRKEPEDVDFDMVKSVSVTSGATKIVKPIEGMYERD